MSGAKGRFDGQTSLLNHISLTLSGKSFGALSPALNVQDVQLLASSLYAYESREFDLAAPCFYPSKPITDDCKVF